MMEIVSYCRILHTEFSVNGVSQAIASNEDNSFELALYKQLELAYPKFHKMDLLAKISFLGSELLIKNYPAIQRHKDDEIAQIFANSESSEYADLRFEESYKLDKSPSPSQFVYTLPNVMMGEIAIKNKWFGENLFLLIPQFDAKEICENIHLILANGHKACLFAWVNVASEKLDAFFCLIETKQSAKNELNEETILKLYTS